jgi:hypothetical protein
MFDEGNLAILILAAVVIVGFIFAVACRWHYMASQKTHETTQ